MSILMALFFSFFVAVPATVILVFIISAILAFPMAKARKEILSAMPNSVVATKEAIEREMAKKYPTLYSIQTYMGAGVLTFLFCVYLISVAVMVFLF